MNPFLAGLLLLLPPSQDAALIARQPIGSGTPGFAGDGGPAADARLDQPFDLAFDPTGNLFFTDTFNHRVRRVDAHTGLISTIAGNGQPGFSGDGAAALEASINEPYGIAVDADGTLYFADRLNRRVRRVDAHTGLISTIAGDGTESDTGDGGPATKAGLIEPNGVALDHNARHLFIADVGACRIRVVDLSTGLIATAAGTGRRRHSGDSGPATNADLHGARAVDVDRDGNLWIVEREGNRLRRVDTATGLISTIAGTGDPGYEGDGGPPAQATFRGPKELALAPDGTLLIVDTENHAIRRINPNNNTTTTVVGDGQPGPTGIGGPAAKARLDRPHGVAVAPDGSIWIADTNNHRLVRIASDSPEGHRASTPRAPDR